MYIYIYVVWTMNIKLSYYKINRDKLTYTTPYYFIL